MQRRSSSSSSDIMVATAATSSSPRTGLDTNDKTTTLTMGAADLKFSKGDKWPSVTAHVVEGGRLLIVRFNDPAARTEFEGIITTPSSNRHDQATADETLLSDHEGPNARGTYSKVYAARHPEIEWVHRGQGRYLPAAKAKSLDLPATTE